METNKKNKKKVSNKTVAKPSNKITTETGRTIELHDRCLNEPCIKVEVPVSFIQKIKSILKKIVSKITSFFKKK